MIATLSRPEKCVVLHNVSWHTYEALLAEAGDSHVRFTYDEGDLEVMTLSFAHEHAGEWIGVLIHMLALELDLPICSGGSTTLKASLQKKGLEPDKCFWIANEKTMRGQSEWTADDPPPDLVVEVDISNSSLNRLGIYAALGVPEIWHYDGTTFKALVLASGGKYRRITKSRSFPTLPLTKFVRFVTDLGAADQTQLLKAFRQWLQGEVVRSR